MTTGRINQVRTIGGARAPAGPRSPGCRPQCVLARTPARPHAGPLALRRRARGLSPVQAASDARARLHASGRAGGRAAHAGWSPRALAHQPPACAALSLGPVQAASDTRASPRASEEHASGRAGGRAAHAGWPPRALAPAPGLRRPQSRRLQTPGRVSPRLGGARLWPGWGPSCPCGVAPSGARSPGRTASPPPSGSHVRSAGASMRQAVARPSAAGRDRRNLKLARRTGCGPAAASATPPPPSTAALPHFHTTFDSAHNAILR